MAKYKVKVKTNVFRMLDNHVLFLAKVSPKSAKSLKQTFINTVRTLDENPEHYPRWQPDFELPLPYHQVLIKKRYLVIFYIKENNVYVDYFLDCRMDNSQIILNF